MKRYLVFCRASDQSLHHGWAVPSSERNYDIFLEYFGDRPNRFAGDAEYYSQQSGTHKFERLASLYEEQQEIFLRYEAIWIVDDDISANAQSVNRMFELFHENGLWLAQPALTTDSYYSHKITLYDPRYLWRFTNFVEVMAPVFSRSALQKCITTFHQSKSSWGLDFAWVKILGEPTDKIAILDETQVKHTRPVGRGSLYSGIAENRYQDFYQVSERFGVIHPYSFKIYGGKRRMQIVSVSMVKNESDIIESFVRYHLLFFDHMIILDNGSTDDTYEILQRLAQEGLSLSLVKDDTTAYIQPQIMSRLLKNAAGEGQYDFIVPLDADEFLFNETENNLRSCLEQLRMDRVYYIKWRTFLPHIEDRLAEKFIPARMQHARLDKYETFYKVLVPTQLVLQHGLGLVLGNHDVTPKDEIKHEVLKELKLAHYPIRSMEQLKSKVLVGWINHLSRHDRKPNEAWHWERMYEAIMAGKIQTHEELGKLAKEYTSHLLNNFGYHTEIEVRRCPIRLPQGISSIPIKYTIEETVHAELNIIRNAEKLAMQYAELKRQSLANNQALHIRTDGYYQLVNRQYGTVLGVDKESRVRGTAVVQGTNIRKHHQQWKLVAAGEGYYFIVNRNSGLVLDIENVSQHEGAHIIQWDSYGGPNQQWYIAPIGSTDYCIVNRHSFKFLDAVQGSKAVIQRHARGFASQHWCMIQAEY